MYKTFSWQLEDTSMEMPHINTSSKGPTRAVTINRPQQPLTGEQKNG
jgi:hypothetical protein